MSRIVLNKEIAKNDPNLIFPITEKVIQFGTGVLLRGLPDHFIHNANQQNIFNGSIVVMIGKRNTGKSFLVKDLLYYKRDVPIGTVIARIECDDNIVSNINIEVTIPTPSPIIENPRTENVAQEEKSTNAISSPIEVPFIPAPSPKATDIQNIPDGKFYSPLVMNIAQNEGIPMQELQQIKGTGNQGRVSKKDILNYIAERKNIKLNVFSSI